VMEEEKKSWYTKKGNFVFLDIFFIFFLFQCCLLACHCIYKTTLQEDPVTFTRIWKNKLIFYYLFCLVMCFGLFTQNYNKKANNFILKIVYKLYQKKNIDYIHSPKIDKEYIHLIFCLHLTTCHIRFFFSKW